VEEKLKDLLTKNKSEIVKGWINTIFETYPKDTSIFLKTKEDRFTNPVGFAVINGIEKIFDALLEDGDFNESLPYLRDIIKVRAVQDFSPSKATAFIFDLKNVVRDQLDKELRQGQFKEDLHKFETRVDELALLTFNIYVECREQIYKLKTDELKRMTFLLLKKANLMSEIPFEEFELRDPHNQL
jgi:hypothetical protein